MHELEHISLQVLKLINANLGVEDALIAEKGQDEVIEDQILLLLEGSSPWAQTLGPAAMSPSH